MLCHASTWKQNETELLPAKKSILNIIFFPLLLLLSILIKLHTRFLFKTSNLVLLYIYINVFLILHFTQISFFFLFDNQIDPSLSLTWKW